ncbi:hypothetical protein KHA80_22220 [Anaerobacillus sp. HL2]|nr:hypothetical protein KHA80_22220 [Anaerobacillus sp. HL2]
MLSQQVSVFVRIIATNNLTINDFINHADQRFILLKILKETAVIVFKHLLNIKETNTPGILSNRSPKMHRSNK